MIAEHARVEFPPLSLNPRWHNVCSAVDIERARISRLSLSWSYG